MLNAYRSREDALSAIANRLARLIKQSENPQAEMKAIESRLMDAGLSDWSAPKGTSPDEFVATMIEQNPEMLEVISGLRNEFRPELIETPGELISQLLPALNDHE